MRSLSALFIGDRRQLKHSQGIKSVRRRTGIVAWRVRVGSSTGEATFRSEPVLRDTFSDLIDLLVKSSRKLGEKLIQFGRLLRHDRLSTEFAYAILQTPGPKMPRYKAA